MPDLIRSLVVDDDAGIRFFLAETLKHAGHEVTPAESGETALELLRDNYYNLAVVDLRLGTRVDGIRVLEAVRWRWPDTAVILLTAHGSLDSAMAAIRESVDRYLLKPTEPRELLDTVHEVLARRRHTGRSDQPAAQWQVLMHGPIAVDLDKHQATLDGKPIDLTPAEFSLLAHMLQNAHRVCSPEELVRATQGYEADHLYEARQVIKWYIHRLRSKIEPDPANPRYILNVRGVGYILAPKEGV
jgi:DNA-binding response OmpR family regulator